MKEAKRWLVWRMIDGRKVPHYVDGTPRAGTLDLEADQAKLVTWEELEACEVRATGRGFALGPDGKGGYWQGIDFDDVKENNLKDAVESVPGYVEISPSRTGAHAFGYGKAFRNHPSEGTGVEAYCTARYFTFTGETLRDPPLTDLKDWVSQRFGETVTGLEKVASEQSFSETEYIDEKQENELRSALQYIDNRDYAKWIEVGLCLRTIAPRDGDPIGFKLFKDWSLDYNYAEWHRTKHRQQKLSSGKPYKAFNPDHLWKDFYALEPREKTFRSIFYEAKQKGWGAPRPKTTDDGLMEPVDLSDIDDLPAQEFIIDGFIPTGSLVIAGERGLGKSTTVAALVALVVGLATERHALQPSLRRKVYWITEDVPQVKRIFQAMRKTERMVGTLEDLSQWVHVIGAVRCPPKDWARAINRALDGVELGDGYNPEPLIIFDTIAANFDIKDENDNAAVSAALASIRQGTQGASLWMLAHTAKGISRDEIDNITARGASAFEADVQGVAFMFSVAELEGVRFMRLGKRRFVPSYVEIAARATELEVEAKEPWSGKIRVEKRLVVDLEQSSEADREQAKADARDIQEDQKLEQTKKRFDDFVLKLLSEKQRVIAYLGTGRNVRMPERFEGLFRLSWDTVWKAIGVGKNPNIAATGRAQDVIKEYAGIKAVDSEGEWVELGVPFSSL
jgi:hypothetical protein